MWKRSITEQANITIESIGNDVKRKYITERNVLFSNVVIMESKNNL